MQPRLSILGGALNLSVFICGLTIATFAARLATADVAPGAQMRAAVKALAERTHGQLTDASLRSLVEAENGPLFDRFDPAAKHAPAFAAIHAFEGPAPNLRLFALPPASAQAVNAELPFTLDNNPPARPFVFRGSAADRANALTCLTQAVYYEAGFEPGAGEQAVAQVVLNRMRHPIFPHSVCGVVYQGAALKTGCQFSFTCDGALARKPQPAAWDRARKVAEMALGGFVMKAVGGATHYHTQWVVPWWQPTVSKVAQIGAHIFYRWQGALGLPAAFNVRYAGNEHIAASPTTPGVALTAAVVAAHEADNRVHSVIRVAEVSAPQTPRERMAALAARGALGAGFDPAAVQAGSPAPAASAAAKAEPTAAKPTTPSAPSGM